MKKMLQKLHLLFLSIICFVPGTFAQNITTNEVNTSICRDVPFTVSFTATGPFFRDNVFTVELSDLSGEFKDRINIGSLKGNISGKIEVLIPVSTPLGSNYRIRVVSSSPYVAGPKNTSDLNLHLCVKKGPTAIFNKWAFINTETAYSTFIERAADTDAPTNKTSGKDSDAEVRSALEVFPNPVINEATIRGSVPGSDGFTLTIANVSGQTVFRREFFGNEDLNNFRYDFSSLSAGAYLVILAAGKELTVKKILKR